MLAELVGAALCLVGAVVAGHAATRQYTSFETDGLVVTTTSYSGGWIVTAAALVAAVGLLLLDGFRRTRTRSRSGGVPTPSV